MTDNEKLQYALILMDKGAIYRNGHILPDMKSEDEMSLLEIDDKLMTTLLLLKLVDWKWIIEAPDQWSGYVINDLGRASAAAFVKDYELATKGS